MLFVFGENKEKYIIEEIPKKSFEYKKLEKMSNEKNAVKPYMKLIAENKRINN